MAVCTVESHKGWSGGRGVCEVSEWAVGACGAVGVVCGGGRRSCGIWVGELLMMLLHQIMIPVVLLPLRIHGGWAKYHWIVGVEHRLLI